MAYIIKDNRLHFVSEASKILSASLDYNVTLANVAKLLTDTLADFCMIDLMDEDGNLERVATRVGDPKKRALAQKMFDFPADPMNQGGIYDAARKGRSILTRFATDEWLKGVAKISKERKVLRELGVKSFIFAPLRSREKIIGVLTLVSSKENFAYTEDDAVLAQEIADRAGIAVDKAQLYQKAQEAIRAREEFMSIAAHELRTPLTIILLHLEKAHADIKKLTSKHTGMEEVLKIIERSEKQGVRLSKLINDLLDVSLASNEKLNLEKEPVDLNVLIEEVLAFFSIQTKKAKTFVVFDRAKKPVVGNWDKIRIEQVMSNLLSNAFKYGKGKPVNISVKNDGKQAIVAITDKGIGVKPDFKKEIFDLFKRDVPSDFKGIGIGLYISKQIIEAHDGKIKVDSEQGKGTTFTMSLPLG